MSRPDRAVFRLPGVSVLIPFLIFVCATPLATAGAKFWLALYVLPLVALAYVLLTRTVANADSIRTTGLLGLRRIGWSELDGFEFHGPRWAIAVGLDGRRLRLPMVRPRDLPRLAQVSGGRLLLGPNAPAVEPADVPGDPAGLPGDPAGLPDDPAGLPGYAEPRLSDQESTRSAEAASPVTTGPVLTEPTGPVLAGPTGPGLIEPTGPGLVEPTVPGLAEPTGPEFVEPTGPAGAEWIATSPAVSTDRGPSGG